MIAKVLSASNHNNFSQLVNVEVDFIPHQLPGINYVGVSQSIKDSKERIWGAIRNSGFEYPRKRMTVSFSPAGITRSGSHFDLSIALGILIVSEQVQVNLDKCLFLGELGLDGRLNKVPDLYSYIDLAIKEGIENVYIPYDNSEDIYGNIKVHKCHNLQQVIRSLQGNLDCKVGNIELIESRSTVSDFANITGLDFAKRALEIAVCGGHSILLTGSLGSGKTSLISSLQSIYPDLSQKEMQEIVKIYNVNPVERPFRSPHSSISESSMIGGGAKIHYGEITKANNGILFLDEINLFKKNVLNSLRKPIDQKRISLTRIGSTVNFPARFHLIAAMNPCPCGNLYEDKCECSADLIEKHLRSIPKPIIDRIDMYVAVKQSIGGVGESSIEIRKRVTDVRNIQYDRYGKLLNSDVSSKDIFKFIGLNDNLKNILNESMAKFSLSTRSYFSIIKVSRTIADMAGSKEISEEHLIEALQYTLR